MSIVCYDDLPLADYLRPALTRVRVPLAELGAQGVDEAIAQVLGGPPRDVLLGVEPQLIVAGSTAPPRPGR